MAKVFTRKRLYGKNSSRAIILLMKLLKLSKIIWCWNFINAMIKRLEKYYRTLSRSVLPYMGIIRKKYDSSCVQLTLQYFYETLFAVQWKRSTEKNEPNLMNFLPALEILSSYRRMIVKQRLAEHRIGLVNDAVIERRQALGILVIRTSTQLQKRLHRLQTVPFNGAVHRRQAFLRSIVQESTTVHQRNDHLRRLLQGRR